MSCLQRSLIDLVKHGWHFALLNLLNYIQNLHIYLSAYTKKTKKNTVYVYTELIKRGHPAKIIDDTFSKLLTPVRDRSSTALESIPFIYTYNSGIKFNKNKITKCLENVKTNKFVQAFWNKRPFVSTRQSDNLQKNFDRSKFNMSLVKHIPEKIVGLFNCSDNRCVA